MSETRTATFIVHEDPDGGDYIEVATSGDHGEGERLVAVVEASGRRIVSIDERDVSDVPPDSAFWDIGALGPRPETSRTLGRMAGEIVQADA